MAPRTRNFPAVALFATYVVVLTAVILFKFPFSYQAEGSGRTLNLIPFAGSFAEDGSFRLGEVVDNLLIFVPFGVFLRMLKVDWSFVRQTLPILGTTVAFEAIQYAFAIGRADITDVLSNTLGGILGIGIYASLTKVLGRRAEKVVTTAAMVLTIVALLFLAFLFVRSRSAPAR